MQRSTSSLQNAEQGEVHGPPTTGPASWQCFPGSVVASLARSKRQASVSPVVSPGCPGLMKAHIARHTSVERYSAWSSVQAAAMAMQYVEQVTGRPTPVPVLLGEWVVIVVVMPPPVAPPPT